jgi:GNAT superfamily N-acetyltransferase
MTEFHLRPSQLSDNVEIATLFAYSCEKAYNHIFPPSFLSRYTPKNQLERWTTHLNTIPSTHRVIVAATAPGEVFGFIEVGPSDEELIGEIHYLFVLPTAAEKGVGTALLRSGEQWLKEQGYHGGLLWVFCGNELAKRFYFKEGWEGCEVQQQEPTLLQAGYSIMECKLTKSFQI